MLLEIKGIEAPYSSIVMKSRHVMQSLVVRPGLQYLAPGHPIQEQQRNIPPYSAMLDAIVAGLDRTSLQQRALLFCGHSDMCGA